MIESNENNRQQQLEIPHEQTALFQIKTKTLLHPQQFFDMHFQTIALTHFPKLSILLNYREIPHNYRVFVNYKIKCQRRNVLIQLNDYDA